MKPEDIMQFEVGSEIDALIARNVMGQTDFDHPGFYWTEGTTEDGRDGWEGFYCPRCSASEGSLEPCIKRYSADIAAAWAVVEKHPHYFSLIRSNDSNWRPAPFLDKMVWRCRFYAPERFEALANTAPLAICRAALLALPELDVNKA